MEDSVNTSPNEGRFAPEVELVLRQSGWFPGRTVSEEQLRKWLVIDWPTGTGIYQTRMFPAAWRVLREFGGLTVRPGAMYSSPTFFLDPLRVERYVASEDWFIDEWCADGALFPLGGDQEASLAITGTGRVINNFDSTIGNTFEQALTNLITGREPRTQEVDIDKFREASDLLSSFQHRFGR